MIGLKTKLERNLRADASGCLLWQAGTNGKGYGQFRLHGVVYQAHRVAWMVYRGPIPPGLCVCHACDVPLCCEPEHLFVGTHAENAYDAMRKGHRSRGETHGTALLRDNDVPEIRAMYRDGVSPARIAAVFGVSKSTIWNIVHQRTWQHVV
jgi:hypothetical protein